MHVSHTLLQFKKEYEIVKTIKEQSGWEWSQVTLVPNIPAKVMNKYIQVSDILFPYIFRHPILLQVHPKSKPYFIKVFPMYDDIVDVLGDACASGFVSSDGRKKPAMSQVTLGPSQALSPMQPSAASSFAIDPVLEAISLEM